MKKPYSKKVVSALILVSMPILVALVGSNLLAQEPSNEGDLGFMGAEALNEEGTTMQAEPTSANTGEAIERYEGANAGRDAPEYTSDFSNQDKAFGLDDGSSSSGASGASGDSGASGAAGFSGADEAFEQSSSLEGAQSAAPSSEGGVSGIDSKPEYISPEEQERRIKKYFTAFMKTKLGSLPASLISTFNYEQYEAWRRAKAEKYSLSNGAYGTKNYVPRRQRALEQVIQQAKDLQYSQKMIIEIAKMFQLQQYNDYDYDVRYGRDPSGFLTQLQRIKRQRQRRARQQRELARKMKRFVADEGEGVTRDEREEIGFTGDRGGVTTNEPLGPLRPGGGDDGIYGSIDDRMKELMAGLGGKEEIPEEVVSSLEAAIHNAILDKLKGKGFDVAALNVFLHNKHEVKVIVIITTSSLAQSQIRGTLRNVRDIIEKEVLEVKFAPLRLAQLSSFTILNEVDNHFYEHAVLYWQMQLAGWDSRGQRLQPSTPGVGEQMPQSDPGGEGDRMLTEFLGN